MDQKSVRSDEAMSHKDRQAQHVWPKHQDLMACLQGTFLALAGLWGQPSAT